MRAKVLWILALAMVIAPLASADIILTFSQKVNLVSFYSAEEGIDLTATSNGDLANTATVDFGFCFLCGGVTPFADTNVTQVTFSGTPSFYVIDDIQYTVGNDPTVYTLTFDEFTQENAQVGNYYQSHSLPGGPVFNNLAQVYSEAWDINGANTASYGAAAYLPPSSCNGVPGDNSAFVSGFFNNPVPNTTCSVLFEGQVQTPTVPEPGSLLLFGSGLMGIAGVLRRKLL